MASPTLERVLAAWDLAPGPDDREPGASAADIERAQRMLGRTLPADVVDLYRAVGGGGLLGGYLDLHPLTPDPGETESMTLATASDTLRSWEWPIAEEVVVFGGNGADAHFGLWLPAGGGDFRPVVVEIGESFDEDGNMAIAGDDMASFLLGWTAFSLGLTGDSEAIGPAMSALGVPEELRALVAADDPDALDAALRWASPHLPDPHPDPYERPLTAEQVGRFAAGGG